MPLRGTISNENRNADFADFIRVNLYIRVIRVLIFRLGDMPGGTDNDENRNADYADFIRVNPYIRVIRVLIFTSELQHPAHHHVKLICIFWLQLADYPHHASLVNHLHLKQQDN